MWRFDNLDPQVGMFFEKELTSVQEDVYKKDKPPKNGFDELPQYTQDPEWSQEIEIRMWDTAGLAEFMADYASDLPLVSLQTEKDQYPVRAFGAAYQYSKDEIQKASENNLDLERKKGLAAREVIERRQNRIMWFGAPVVGLFGLLNYPHIPRRQIAVKFNQNNNANTIRKELNSFINSVFDIVEGDEGLAPTKILMPPNPYTHIAGEPWNGDASGAATDTTILTHFMRNNPFVETVEPVRELKGAGPNGEDVMVAMRPDKDRQAHRAVKPFTQEDPERRNLAWRVNTWAKSGGFVSQFPLEMAIGEFPA
ncbi:MAG: major capsid family protein [Bradymonadaceae bacterium]